MPEHDFFVFGKNTNKEYRQGNVFYYPWENDILNIYKRAKLVIVPSQWNEAYGRVAKESIILNIPVIVSDIGGLKEAVDFDENKLVKNYKSTDDWVQKIKNFF
jgi:glycosyltransferase involved in cell wall biosynthesis